ncbi:MAG: TonB-dependent receptor plug domain-containing protein [Gammaproteobacteria bacterium]|nr:TonB-dependent receptor plug domain-containing protein [Gammaproteobacteria bacterium]
MRRPLSGPCPNHTRFPTRGTPMRLAAFLRICRSAFVLPVAAACLVSLPSVAQDLAAEGASEVEELIVTGTRIRDRNVFSSSQITTVDSDDIADRGITRVEDYLNDLPQVSPGQAITASNGASGTATVNLRNLGCARTLVLLNGQRLAPGTTGAATAPTSIPSRRCCLSGWKCSPAAHPPCMAPMPWPGSSTSSLTTSSRASAPASRTASISTPTTTTSSATWCEASAMPRRRGT